MLIQSKRGWALPEQTATPEAVFLSRRTLMGAAAGIALAPWLAKAAAAAEDPTADLYPAMPNARYKLDRPLTAEGLNAEYNNFYEFGSHKFISSAAQKLKVRPWTVKIDGLVEKPIEIDNDALIRQMGLEERLYRHRCVEAWSMTIPWTGFAMAKLVALAKPLGSAKYLRMETFMNPDVASGQRQSWYPWPYVEGLTMAEATNELTFLAVGTYGKPMAKQHGAPLRLAMPWKYGFKSIKSIVRFSFVEKRPETFWGKIAPTEYGFWANVNPQVPHPRWSQATEEVLGTNNRVPTLLYNGYGEFVADLYKGMDGEKLYM